MAKYHNSVAGPRICKASVQACPVGGSHFDNINDAENSYQETLKEKFGEFSTLLKKDTKEKVLQASYKAREKVSLNVQKVKASPSAVASVKKLREIKEAVKEIASEGNEEFGKVREDFKIAKSAVKDTTQKARGWSEARISDVVKVTKQTANDFDQSLGRVLEKAGGIESHTTWDEVKRDNKALIRTGKLVSSGVISNAGNKSKNSLNELKRYIKKAKMNLGSMKVRAKNLVAGDTFDNCIVVGVKKDVDKTRVSYIPMGGGVILSTTVDNDTEMRVDRSTRRDRRQSDLSAIKVTRASKTPLSERIKMASEDQKQVFRTLVGKSNPRHLSIVESKRDVRMQKLMKQLRELRHEQAESQDLAKKKELINS